MLYLSHNRKEDVRVKTQKKKIVIILAVILLVGAFGYFRIVHRQSDRQSDQADHGRDFAYGFRQFQADGYDAGEEEARKGSYRDRDDVGCGDYAAS